MCFHIVFSFTVYGVIMYFCASASKSVFIIIICNAVVAWEIKLFQNYISAFIDIRLK